MVHGPLEARSTMDHSSSFIELPIVDTHPPTGDSLLRNEFIFLIADNSQSTILRHHLYWTDPFTVRDEVDKSSLK
jgi:hypothetical protein